MMELSEEQLFELASAAHDGELSAAASDLGLTPSQAEAQLQQWSKLERVRNSLRELSAEMSRPVELSEFETKRILHAAVHARPPRKRRMLRNAGVAAAVAGVLISYSVWSSSGPSSSTNIALQSDEANAPKQRMKSSTTSTGASGLPREPAQTSAPQDSAPLAASAQGQRLPIDLGEVSDDAALVQSLRARVAANDTQSAGVSSSSSAFAFSADASEKSAISAVPSPSVVCVLTAYGTLLQQPFGIVDAGSNWNVVNPSDCSVLRSIAKQAAP